MAGLEAFAAGGGEVVQGSWRGQLLRQPHRRRDRQGDRRAGRQRIVRRRGAQGPARQGRHRQRQDRLSALSGHDRNAALESPGRRRGRAAAAAVGLHRDQGSGLFRHILCRDPDWPRHGQHHAAQDHGRLPRPRRSGADPDRRRGGRHGYPGPDRNARPGSGGRHRPPRHRWRRQVRPGLRRPAGRRGRQARPSSGRGPQRPGDQAAGRSGGGGGRGTCQGRRRGLEPSPVGRRREPVDRRRRGEMAGLARRRLRWRGGYRRP